MPLHELDNAYVERDGHRLDIVIDRPDARNALNRDVIADLMEAFEFAQDVNDARSITLTGEGPVFCAGMDLEMMKAADGPVHEAIMDEVNALFDLIDECRLPVVVGIEGAGVAGGFEMTLPADFRIIGETAKYGVLEVKMGLFPAGGSTQRLPRLVGMSNAKAIILLGDYVDPHDAAEMGLIYEVCPDDAVTERTRALGDELAARSPLGVQRALESLNMVWDVPLEDGLEFECLLCRDLFETADAEEGFASRLEGRDPEFDGR
jgi:enoyl-CoA hydratase